MVIGQSQLITLSVRNNAVARQNAVAGPLIIPLTYCALWLQVRISVYFTDT